jgi:hypothetical protein
MALTARRRIALLVVLVLALGAAVILTRPAAPPPPSTSAGPLRIYRPTQSWVPGYVRAIGETITRRKPTPPLGVPCGPLPASVAYTPLPVGGTLSHPAGAAFARHPTPPDPLAAYFPAPSPVPAGQVAVSYVAALRYDVAGKTIDVITCAPSPVAAQRELILGNTEVPLGPGRSGFVPNISGNPPPAVVRFAEGPLIVEVRSDDPSADVARFAQDVIISK